MCKYVVVDLEMCKVPKSRKTEDYRWSMETIQIGAVLLNEEYEIIDTFNTYVKPEYGMIDTYIHGLTGIDKRDTLEAPMMNVALQQFTDWIPSEDVKLIQWSESDKEQIQHEMIGKSIMNERLTSLEESWIDCQKLFGDRLDPLKQYKLSDALFIAGVDVQGQEHNALSDAVNTAVLYSKICDDKGLVLNPDYEKAAKEEVSHLSFSLGNLFQGIDLRGIA